MVRCRELELGIKPAHNTFPEGTREPRVPVTRNRLRNAVHADYLLEERLRNVIRRRLLQRY